jgi:hypothetical protein
MIWRELAPRATGSGGVSLLSPGALRSGEVEPGIGDPDKCRRLGHIVQIVVGALDYPPDPPPFGSVE